MYTLKSDLHTLTFTVGIRLVVFDERQLVVVESLQIVSNLVSVSCRQTSQYEPIFVLHFQWQVFPEEEHNEIGAEMLGGSLELEDVLVDLLFVLQGLKDAVLRLLRWREIAALFCL